LTEDVFGPIPVDYLFVTSGFEHACGIQEWEYGQFRNIQNVHCWGANNFGQTNTPKVAFLHIDSGDLHTCGIRLLDRVIQCWGYNGNDVLLNPYRTVPFLSVSAGARHTCAIADAEEYGYVKCWGGADTWDYGQTIPSPDVRYHSVSAGTYNTCGIQMADGHVKCWGGNSKGQSTVHPDVPYSYVDTGVDPNVP
jgi:hypothetical protein